MEQLLLHRYRLQIWVHESLKHQRWLICWKKSLNMKKTKYLEKNIARKVMVDLLTYLNFWKIMPNQKLPLPTKGIVVIIIKNLMLLTQLHLIHIKWCISKCMVVTWKFLRTPSKIWRTKRNKILRRNKNNRKSRNSRILLKLFQLIS